MAAFDHSKTVARALGRKLRQVRLAQECTLGEVACEAKVSTAYLSRVENGERYPERDTLTRILMRGLSLPVEETDELLLLAEYAPTCRPRQRRATVR